MPRYLPPRKQQIIHRKERIIKLHEEGYSFSEIGKMVKSTAQWAHQVVKQHREDSDN